MVPERFGEIHGSYWKKMVGKHVSLWCLRSLVKYMGLIGNRWLEHMLAYGA